MMTTIDLPGVYTIPEVEYHADPVPGGSLSCSGARKVLDCPAKYAYDRANPPVYNPVFEFGHAAHAQVLGVGAPVDVLDFDNWRTDAATQARDESRMYGRTPLLRKDAEIVDAMAAAIREHEIASRLLDPAHGKPEQSLFWRDERSGLMLRSRLDWLPDADWTEVTGHYTIVDYKTALSAKADDFGVAAHRYGYHMQDAWYADAVRNTLGIEAPKFVFVVQEKTAPYVVTVIELDDEAKRVGAELNRRAIGRYLECSTSGVWPAYATSIVSASLPAYAIRQHDEEFANFQEEFDNADF